MADTTFIYALCDPRTREVRYIGKSDDPYKRYCHHLWDKSETHKVHWIRELAEEGFLPVLQILEECQYYEWEQKECDWIAFEKRCGCNLTNLTDGGDGGDTGGNHVGRGFGWHHNDATREKQRRAAIGRRFYSEEHRRRFVLSQKGKVGNRKGAHHTEESNRKNREAHLGKKASEETKRKMRIAAKIRKQQNV